MRRGQIRIGFALRQRGAIEGLRAGIVTHQIEGKTAISGHLGFGDADLFGFREQA